MILKGLIGFIGLLVLSTAPSAEETDRRETYIQAVTRGAGLMPWQETGPATKELEFRRKIEDRKTAMLRHREVLVRPVMYSEQEIERVRQKIDRDDLIRDWFKSNLNLADSVIKQGSGYVERMIPKLTPCNSYGFTCPHCVGKKSQEAVGSGLASWSYREPDQLTCRQCGHVYPSSDYPETATLEAPRSGQTFTYYLNEEEREDPENKTGDLAYHWVGYPIHVSFTGIIRENKISFMKSALNALSFSYQFTKDPKYAVKTKEILLRFAECYPRWLYHDYWDTIADCDPMYAAWHDKNLPIEWKRHLCTNAYKRDTLDESAMLQSYWGAGRIHPSTDGVNGLAMVCVAYDFVADATNADGTPVWSDEERIKVERDFILEYVIGAEPFVGGEGRADEYNNKTPRVYLAQAAVAKCLGIPELADVAIRGYEAVRDNSFLYDGLSTESPSYTNMYLSELLPIPETLLGFEWPKTFEKRTGVYDPYREDPQLERMYRAVVDQLRSDWTYLPLSDSHVGTGPSQHIIEYGLERYPQIFRGKYPALTGDARPDQFGLFYLDHEELELDEPFQLPEIYFPAWMTSIFRHGEGKNAACLSLSFNPTGGHRHQDNLSLYYYANGEGNLGDLGYVGDMPVNEWIRSTQSHNLVVVDGKDQIFGGEPERMPKLNLLATTPQASIVEAESKAYRQCSEYRRMVILVKGPEGKTFAVDLFRVAGGSRHDYRLYSELASNDSTGELLFEFIEFPEEPPLPKIGSSLKREDIFGLRDSRTVTPSNSNWRAVWKEEGRAFRFWNLTAADTITASNGPGQRSLDEPGRRVRYLDVTRKGDRLKSLFAGIHEPSDGAGNFSIDAVEDLEVPEEAGNHAAAIRVLCDWGTYTIYSEFDRMAEIGGFSFKGKIGIHCQPVTGNEWIVATSAETFLSSDGTFGFEDEAPCQTIQVVSIDSNRIEAERPIETHQTGFPEGVRNYMLAHDGKYHTGFPVESISGNTITIARFPVPKLESAELPNLLIRERTP